MSNTWVWISGWGICPRRFQAAAQAALPDYQHLALAPTADALEKVLRSGATRIGGYSFGSLLILSELSQIPKDTDITCLAPFTAFCAEHGRGGSTPLTSLQMLQRRLEEQPLKTLKLFYRLAELADEPCDSLPYDIESLRWGLQQLADIQVDTGEINRVNGYVGLTDALVHATVIHSQWASCRLIERCSHSYRDLFNALQTLDDL